MPSQDLYHLSTEPAAEGFFRYDSVKARVLALSRDEAVVLLAVALDPAPRPIRTAAILGTAGVARTEGSRFDARNVADVFDSLSESRFLVVVDRQLNVDPRLELAAVLSAFARVPEAGKGIAGELLRMTGYEPRVDAAGTSASRRTRDWNFVFDYDAFPRRTRLLLLHDDHIGFQAELKDIQSHHEWRVPARKAEALQAAVAPLAYFDYSFWRHLSTPFRLSAFEYAVAEKVIWTGATADSICAFLADDNLERRDLSDYDEALAGFGASQALHAFRQTPEYWATRPRAGLIAATVAQDEAASAEFSRKLEEEAGSQVGLADLVAELLQLREDPEHRHVLINRLHTFREGPIEGAVTAFKAYAHFLVGNGDLCDQQLRELYGMRTADSLPDPQASRHPDQPALSWMVGLWVYAWTGLKPQPEAIEGLLASFHSPPLSRTGSEYDLPEAPPIAYQPYVKGELLASLASIFPGEPRAAQWREEARSIAEQYHFNYLLHLQSVPESWEYALRVIETVASAKTDLAPRDEAQTRLVWIVDFDRLELLPREQKRGKRGWSKGRKLEPFELVEASGTGRFDAYDDRVIGSARRRDDKPVALGQRYGADVKLEFGRALYHLDGHPRVFIDDNKRVPLELRRSRARMSVDEAEDNLRLSFEPAGAHRAGYHWEKETPTRYRVYEISAEQARLARAIGRETIIPGQERDQVEERVAGLREHVDVASATDLDAEALPEVLGDTRPCAHLLPYGVAYKLELYARPLQGEELYLRIGEGISRQVVGSEVAETVDEDDELYEGRRLLKRDLPAEERAAEAIVRDCPTLRELGHVNYEWTLDDDYAALRVLLELKSLQNEGRISIEHPKGEKLRLVGTTATDNLKLQITKQRDWFEVSGKLSADEGQVVNFRQLLSHLRNGGSEFVELSEGEFIAITAELRSRLEAMEGLLHERGGRVELPPLAAAAFADIADELEDVEVDDAWRETLKRMRESQDFNPTLPPDFNGELRDYQVVGYTWLRRLAEWGVGGCLADDMGLGKTVQALALMVSRAHQGPALVIAPASVTRNWERETERFAPSLSAKLLATSADVRMLEELEAGDLLIVSYGLLSFVEEGLLASRFSTIVLDEAQAIKNPATKRAKLIFKLDADLRIATTGTPIENHLGELWSLFRYLNPGLLGSRSNFNEKYAGPIRRENNMDRADALRKVVRPFILRRRKEEVLKELPPKTEVNLSVQLSDGERALYEALRREAVEVIDGATPNAQRMIVLQQLTRLRQAACHPKLVRPSSQLPSAKLELVGNTVLELIENGHKALIFSQFVKHLRIVEAWVQAAGLKYCYLDGSTPGGKRQRQVESFQRGEADLFLISLKAGGTGLNLTAADFVLHLDPWWNPAAEDQASDRAHRIGQQRPVTVYRFVSEGTIEERILALHAEKRDLADQILTGTDAGGRLSVDDVVSLLREV